MPDITSLLIDIAPFIAIGIAAQMIDGALGMAFGVITQTLLVSAMGVPPATASASVHLVELFTRAHPGRAISGTAMSIGGCFGGWSPSACWGA